MNARRRPGGYASITRIAAGQAVTAAGTEVRRTRRRLLLDMTRISAAAAAACSSTPTRNPQAA